VVELIEQFSGKKIPGVKAGTGEDPAARRTDVEKGSERAGGKLNNRIAQALRVAEKFKKILGYLIQGEALLTHINAVDLLRLEDHMLVQEVELRRVEGERLTASTLEEQKSLWTKTWAANCNFGWMEVLFQAIKIYTINRCGYKELLLLQAQADAVTALGDSTGPTSLPIPPSRKTTPAPGKKTSAKKNINTLPSELTLSNVYTNQENVLLAWASYHIQRSYGLKRPKVVENEYGIILEAEGVEEESKRPQTIARLTDIEVALKDMSAFCQLIHSHKPSFAKSGGALLGYTIGVAGKQEVNFKMFKDSLDQFLLSFEATYEELAVSSRTLLLMVSHLFLNLPSQLPKASVGFQGVLGVSICKTIELSNPSKKKVGYVVSLEGSSEFSIANSEILLLPESKMDFPISFKPVFSTPCASGTVTFLGKG
jgi:hypothetical protein